MRLSLPCRLRHVSRCRQSARRRGQSNQSRQFLRRPNLCPLCSTPHASVTTLTSHICDAIHNIFCHTTVSCWHANGISHTWIIILSYIYYIPTINTRVRWGNVLESLIVTVKDVSYLKYRIMYAIMHSVVTILAHIEYVLAASCIAPYGYEYAFKSVRHTIRILGHFHTV